MYPFLRMFAATQRAKKQPPIGLFETHISYHRIYPWDLDIFWELNNGRTLSIYDLGRVPLAMRTGLLDTMKENHWGLTIAGSSVRYRRRVVAWETIEMRSRCVGWDSRFIYLVQDMWRQKNGEREATSSAVFRSAVTSKAGIVPPPEVATALDMDTVSPELPAWVAAWSAAEDQRVWPPAD